MTEKRHLKIAPSILTSDFTRLGETIDMLNSSQCDYIHLDVMDGVFVPNISFGFPVIRNIAKRAEKPLDVHLMIVDPDRYVSVLRDASPEYVTVHYEACTHLHRSLQNIRANGMKAGVVLNPHTPVSEGRCGAQSPYTRLQSGIHSGILRHDSADVGQSRIRRPVFHREHLP